ncbi:MAG: hypothetical protein WC007_17625 [Pelobacteraceae bacterium]
MRNLRVRLYGTHIILLCAGAVAGFALAYVLDNIPWDFSADLVKARELGMVSEAILRNYPKSRDVLTFFFALGLPVVGALAFWLPWGFKRRAILSRLIYEKMGDDMPVRQPQPMRPLLLAVAALLLVAAYFDLNQFYNISKWNPVTGSWPFLGEEGVFLEWTQRILSGDVRGKDFFTVYGPLMVYPLVLMQKVAGPLVTIGRWYAFFLNLTAYVLLAFIVNRVIRSSFVAMIALLFMVVVYPWMIYSANMSPLRVVLGMVPLVPLLRYRATGNGIWLTLAGAAGGVSFLFSQEVGACSLVASCALVALGFFEGCTFTTLARRSAQLLAGVAAMLLPVMVYFMTKASLPEIVDSLFEYPRLAMLGYAGLIFPSIADAVVSYNAPLVFDNYWIIALYVFVAILLTIRLLTGRIDTKTVEMVFLLVFGALLFRSALGRSSIGKAYFVAPPAFLLLFMALDHSVLRFRKNRIFFRVFMVMVTVVVISAVSAKMTFPQHNISNLRELFLAKNRFAKNADTQMAGVERDDVYHHPDTVREIRLIADFFKTHPTPNGYVYFFPQEAAYYFIFNKKNPTRYPTSYLAITHDMRREVVEDLEEKKPLYVVYSKSTWRIDGIPAYVQVPEIIDYLKANYDVLLDYEPIVFLQRKQVRY